MRLLSDFSVIFTKCAPEPLFGVMFQDYLAYTASACADHKTFPRRFNHCIGDGVKVVLPGFCRDKEGRARKGQGLELVMQLGSERSGQECARVVVFHLSLVDHVHKFDAG